MTQQHDAETRSMTLVMLRAMGKTEAEAIQLLSKHEQRGARKILMTETEATTFGMLCSYGKSEKDALELVEQKRGHKFTDRGDDEGRATRRAAFAKHLQQFKPFRHA